MYDLMRFKTLVFDCDGVILDSNRVKTRAFYAAALPYGKCAAQQLVDYHAANGGISRYRKFDSFLRHIIGQTRPDENQLENLLADYARHAWNGLLSCRVADGIEELRDKTATARWMVVSGGDQSELRRLFHKRGLLHLFDGGIFGSPDTKEQILESQIDSGNILMPAVFFGDSRYDYLAAKGAGLAFVFVRQWSEFTDWADFFSDKAVSVINGIGELGQSDLKETPAGK